VSNLVLNKASQTSRARRYLKIEDMTQRHLKSNSFTILSG
jgi:hypothetical protein